MYNRKLALYVIVLGLVLQLPIAFGDHLSFSLPIALAKAARTYCNGVSISLLIAGLTLIFSNELLLHGIPTFASIADLYDGDSGGKLFNRIRKAIEKGKKIDILALHGIYHTELLFDLLKKKAGENDTAIRMAIASPDSSFVSILRNSTVPPLSDSPWCRAKKMLDKLVTETNGRVQAKFYNSWNSCSIIRVDDRLFVTQYLAHTRSRNSIWFELKQGKLYYQFMEHFEKIFIGY